MGTTAQKLEYLGTTKSQLKDMINYGLPSEEQITSSTTFRNYVSSLFNAFLESLNDPSTLFNNLPKITGSGSNITLNDTANAPMRIMLNASELEQRNIPSEYTQIEYIETTGTQYIDTGIKPTSNIGVSIKAITKNNLDIFADNVIIGSRDSDGNRYFIYLPTSQNFFGIAWASNTLFNDITINATTEYNVLMNYNNDKKLFLNGNQITYTFGTYSGNNYNLFIGGSNNSGNFVASYYGKIKEVKITDNTTLVRHFIPCYRVSDNVIGMYDLVGDKFYTNAGTGTFTYGAISTPSPDYPQDIHTISGSNTIRVSNSDNSVSQEADIDLSSKNLAYTGWAEDFVSRINDTTKAKLKSYENRNCLFYTASAGYQEYDTKYMFKINWKANTQYTISYYGKSANGYLNLVIEHTDGTTVGIPGTPILDWTKVLLTSTKNKTIKYIRITWSGGDTYIDLDTFMVYEGTKEIDYVPYYEPINYCKIGNYKDVIFKNIPAFSDYDNTLEEGAWYIKKNIGKVVLDGTENWTWADTTRYTLAIDKASERNALCNYYTYVNYTGSSSTTSPSFDISSSLEAIGFHNTDLTSLTNFKNDLQAKYNNGTPVIAYYPLATPTYTKITGTLAEQLEYVYQMLKSYKGQTNISQVNNDLPFVISASALEDLNV